MKKEFLIEYGQECELVEKINDSYKVRIYKKDEIIEKLVRYEPIKNEYKYDNLLIEKEGEYSRITKYTTYLKDGKLVYAYKKHNIKRYSDDLLYETEIGTKYKIVEQSPFLSEDIINEEIEKCHAEKYPIKNKIKNLEKEIEDEKNKIEKINKKYDIYNKCEHKWEENGEEEYNNGKSTKKFYLCSVCGNEDIHYWHKLF